MATVPMPCDLLDSDADVSAAAPLQKHEKEPRRDGAVVGDRPAGCRRRMPEQRLEHRAGGRGTAGGVREDFQWWERLRHVPLLG